MTALSKKILLSVICLIVFSHLSSRLQAVEEVRYPAESFAKLDTFEALNLEDADKLFLKKDYKGAYAAYKAYSLEFARSPALGYVLLRMGRCLQGEDVPFFYTMPTAPKISKPSKIKGSAEVLDAGDWSPIEKLILKEVK